MNGGFFKSKKKKGPKFNNPYKIPNDVADDVRRLSNKDLVDKATSEYNTWKINERLKKNDGALAQKKKELKDLNQAVNTHAEVVKLQDLLKAKKLEIEDEIKATVQEELKNLNAPYNEDIKAARDLFRLAMDEISHRKQLGAFDVRNGTGASKDAGAQA